MRNSAALAFVKHPLEDAIYPAVFRNSIVDDHVTFSLYGKTVRRRFWGDSFFFFYFLLLFLLCLIFTRLFVNFSLPVALGRLMCMLVLSFPRWFVTSTSRAAAAVKQSALAHGRLLLHLLQVVGTATGWKLYWRGTSKTYERKPNPDQSEHTSDGQ